MTFSPQILVLYLVKTLKEVGTYGWQWQVGRLLPGVVSDSQANSSLRLIPADLLPSMWKIVEMIGTRTGEVVSTIDMLKSS